MESSMMGRRSVFRFFKELLHFQKILNRSRSDFCRCPLLYYRLFQLVLPTFIELFDVGCEPVECCRL